MSRENTFTQIIYLLPILAIYFKSARFLLILTGWAKLRQKYQNSCIDLAVDFQTIDAEQTLMNKGHCYLICN